MRPVASAKTNSSVHMKFRLTPFAAALGALCAVPSVSLAQEAAAPQAQDASSSEASADRTVVLPAVPVTADRERGGYAAGMSTVGGKLPQEVRDIPQVVNVVTKEVIEAQGAVSLKEALRYVPGITLGAGEGGNIGDNISLRGFSARTDVYLDGFRDRGQYSRDTFHVETVEVLKGPASMLFGRGSTGGVINQVSKVPSLKASSEVSATIGTEDYYRATADLNQPMGEQSAFRISAMGQGQHSTRDFIQSEGHGVAPSLRFGIGSPTEITLSALLQRTEELPDYGFPMIQVSESNPLKKPAKAPHDRFYGYRDDYFDQEVERLSAQVKHKISDKLTLTNRTQYVHYSTEASPTPLGTPVLADGSKTIPTQATPLDLIVAPRQDRDRTIRDTSLYNQTDVVATFATGAIRHTLVGGMELGTDTYRFTRYLWEPTNVAINLGNPVNGDRGGLRYRSQTQASDADSVAFYVNEQADLGEQWKLVLGLRQDKFHAETSIVNFAKDGTASAPAQPAPHTDLMLSTRAGVIFQPTLAQSYYVSYGTSFNPSAEAVTQSASSASLDAEKNQSYEVGGKWDLHGGDLQLGAALFRVEKTNARTTDAALAITTLDGDIRVEGLELSAVGNITPAWQLFGGYVLLDSEVTKSKDTQTATVNGSSVTIPSEGKEYQNTPRHQLTLWNTYAFLKHWELGGGAIYSSERYVNNFETAQIDGYTRYDATMAYKQPRYDLRLNLLNLSDKEYFEGASGGRAMPAKGRTALLTVDYRFGK